MIIVEKRAFTFVCLQTIQTCAYLFYALCIKVAAAAARAPVISHIWVGGKIYSLLI